MSTGTEPTPPDAEGLQFDHAEFAQVDPPRSIACASCHRPIAGAYYEINGTIFCEECRGLVEQHFKGGSKIARFAKALLFGVGAAIASSVIYFLFTYMTGWQLSLISIFCGFLIGKAIRTGTGNRGGWPYQIMAVVLTYLAIGAAYSGISLSGIDFDKLRQSAQAAGLSMAEVYTFLAKLFLRGMVELPIEVVQEKGSILTIVIIGFALWEAWKFTRPARLVVTGPYRVGGEVGHEPVAERAGGDA